ncbi:MULTISPECIES: OmpA family protein [Aliivibrio]|uniref:OmpA family protein n=1 Tax=Aliivibrio finisterrensis TaxID=511998 RepID=A0A4V1Z940_9GAMM|nr:MULTISPECIES: OmpA family protein [Aliivibrio]MDD9180645.1 OmpA family protein [Aliivibrio sp. A6]RYU49569.1 OmpA family protein [Aliivibrio finisterrensis]RYU53302.1 OmpA family protein [Aliivibrio finisterrensis]RYU55413.1 OmpA family protein [Aliivibrio finisterrensis]RYU65809.1 OmpA family protein [Aliivibrio finisterrensis]
MKKHILGMIIATGFLMGCQSTSDDSTSSIIDTPTVESFVNYHNDELAQFVTSDIGSIAKTNDEIILLLNGDKSFDSGSTEVKEESKTVLSQLAKLLNDKPESEVFIAGHTDSRGSKQFNISLSNKRADSVLALLAQQGVDSTRINTYGFGEEEPIASNMNSDGRKKNRRIEIRITPIIELFEE